jgi:hypothetical protein
MNTGKVMGGAALLSALALLSSCSGNTTTDSTPPSCGPFTACGGAIEGNWQIDDVCVEGDLLGMINAQSNPSVPAACQNIAKTATLKASGTFGYASGTETSNLSMTVVCTTVYSQACLSAARGGVTTATPSVCATVQSGINASGSGTVAICSVAGADCSCSITQPITGGPQTDGYAVSGGTLSYTSGSGSVSFCVQGTTLRERSTGLGSGIMAEILAHRI